VSAFSTSGEGVDAIARLAADVFDADAALVSVVGAEQVWHASVVGRESPPEERDRSLAVPIVESGAVTVVDDVSRDDAWAGRLQRCGEPDVRFFAGAPIVAPG